MLKKITEHHYLDDNNNNNIKEVKIINIDTGLKNEKWASIVLIYRIGDSAKFPAPLSECERMLKLIISKSNQ